MILPDGESTGGQLGLVRDVAPAGHASWCAAHVRERDGDEDVPVLMFVTPAGFERYFADGAARAPCSSLRPGRSDRPGRPHE